MNSGEKLTDVYLLLCSGFRKHNIISNNLIRDIINEKEEVINFIHDGYTAVLKIGKSGKFQERSKSYQTNNPEVWYLGKIANVPEWIETDLHSILEDHKYIGFDNSIWGMKKRSEYFYYSQDIVKFFSSLMELNSREGGKELVCSVVKRIKEVKNRFLTWKTPPYERLSKEGILSILTILKEDIEEIKQFPSIILNLVDIYQSAYIQGSEILLKENRD